MTITDESSPFGRVLSVNVGMPTNIPWQGRTVHTGIWKRPVDGSVMVRRVNLDGDGQGDKAGHGGEQRAVMLYQIESYRHWEQHLGISALDMGSFSENLTVTGMADDVVCIGDRYRIGEALLEVTQPRVTCFRVGIRLGQPQMPGLLVAHRRPGFYMRVIEEGRISAGDPIHSVSREPHRMAVAEVDGLLYLPNPDMDRVRDAANIAALSPGWRQSFDDMVRVERQGSAAPTVQIGTEPGWQGFRPLRVAHLHRETADVLSIYLATPDGTQLPHPIPGQYLTIETTGASLPAPIRSYSISSAVDPTVYRVSVKREARGLVSNWLHSNLRLGDELMVAAPRGTFALDTQSSNAIILISAGIGITPVLAMLESLAEAKSTRPIWWLHTASDPAHHGFIDEVANALALLPNARSRVYYTRSASSARNVIAGRLDQSALELLDLPSDATVYTCGPRGFIDSISVACRTLGINDIRSELFGALGAINPGIVGESEAQHPHQPDGPDGSGPKITFARSGLSTAWSPDRYASLLEFAEACGVPTRWSCRSGVCHICTTPKLSGNIAYFSEPLIRPPDGEVLLCCSTPVDNLILDM